MRFLLSFFESLPLPSRIVIATIAIITITAWIYSWFGPGRHARRRKKARRISQKIQSFKEDGAIIAYLRKIDPFVFEELLLDAFEAAGVTVIRNKRYTGDGGIDGQIYYEGRRIPIQAKRYKQHINKAHMEAFTEVTARRKAPFGIFIHTGITGKGSSEVAHGSIPILIISGDRLVRLVRHDKAFVERLLQGIR